MYGFSLVDNTRKGRLRFAEAWFLSFSLARWNLATLYLQRIIKIAFHYLFIIHWWREYVRVYELIIMIMVGWDTNLKSFIFFFINCIYFFGSFSILNPILFCLHQIHEHGNTTHYDFRSHQMFITKILCILMHCYGLPYCLLWWCPR